MMKCDFPCSRILIFFFLIKWRARVMVLWRVMCSVFPFFSRRQESSVVFVDVRNFYAFRFMYISEVLIVLRAV